MTKIVKIPCKLYIQNKESSTIDLSRNNILDLSELGDITLSLEYNPFNRPVITGNLVIMGDGTSNINFSGEYWRQKVNSGVYSGVVFSSTINLQFTQNNNFITPYLK